MIAEAKGTTQKFVGQVYLRNFTITGKFDLNAENEVVFLISSLRVSIAMENRSVVRSTGFINQRLGRGKNSLRCLRSSIHGPS